jgi:hypothetical protein
MPRRSNARPSVARAALVAMRLWRRARSRLLDEMRLKTITAGARRIARSHPLLRDFALPVVRAVRTVHPPADVLLYSALDGLHEVGLVLSVDHDGSEDVRTAGAQAT